MKKLKNLASCKPSEFLKQTNRIRKSAAKWLTATDIMNIRKRQPSFTPDMTKGEKKAAREEQAKENISAMLDEIMDKHPDETLELLALMSFVEPEDVDNHTVSEYLGSFNEMISDPNVLSFFTSLMALVQRAGLKA